MVARAQQQADEGTARVPVDCPAGAVLGMAEDGLHVFRGIPYAAPPVGALRFQPAAPPSRWSGLLDTEAFGSASAQVFDPLEGAWEAFGETGAARAWLGSEDCLTLNIWTPVARPMHPRPVIVYIHGGANWLESSRLPVYSGEAFARGGAVFVSFNYRLGVFGFLDLTPIGGPPGAHSNGLTDQAMALAWVEANIAAFGGDPGNVTLIGESAGSMDIGWLLAGGLLPKGVRRLMLMSGVASVVGLGRDGAASAHTEVEGARRAAAFLGELGYTHFEQLAAAPTAEILTRHAALIAPERILFDQDTLFYPRVGALCPRDPFEAARDGAAADLDIIIGFTAYEMGLWLAWDDDLDRRPPGWAAARMPHLPAAARAELTARYRAWFPNEADGVLGMHLLGDAMFAMPSLWLADLIADGGANVFAYRFDWQADPRRGALHAADQTFLFGRHAHPSGEALIGAERGLSDAHERDEIARVMLEAVLAFAQGGDPSTSPLGWPRYDTTRRTMMLFDAAPRIAADPIAQRRRWWTANVLPRALGGGA